MEAAFEGFGRTWVGETGTRVGFMNPRPHSYPRPYSCPQPRPRPHPLHHSGARLEEVVADVVAEPLQGRLVLLCVCGGATEVRCPDESGVDTSIALDACDSGPLGAVAPMFHRTDAPAPSNADPTISLDWRRSGELETALRAWASAWLPEMLRPTDYLVVHGLPRLPSAKLDRVRRCEALP